jgi:hypothetical protein
MASHTQDEPAGLEWFGGYGGQKADANQSLNSWEA